MAYDIDVAISGSPINYKRVVASATPTGYSSKLIIRPDYPKDLTIENIREKYDNRFDDPRYYYGSNN